MEQFQLGGTDLKITRAGLGTWAIGGDWFMGWGPQEESDSIAAIHEALDQGINWIDTAPAYGDGRAETAVGKALKGRSSADRPIIATKCGVLPNLGAPPSNSLRKNSIEREVEGSLRRLQVESIDLYQIHWPRPAEEIEEGWDTLLRLQQRGLIRWAGVSNFSVAQLELITQIAPVASLQPPYSLLRRSVEQELLPWCKEHGTGVICYSPLESGLLAGSFTRVWADALDAEDWRRKNWSRLHAVNYFAEPELSGLLDWLEVLGKLARKHDRPVSHVALSWVLRRPEVSAVIIGARKRGQIAETVGGAGWQLSSEDLQIVESSFAEYQRRMGRPISEES